MMAYVCPYHPTVNLSHVSAATEWLAWRHRRRWLTIVYCHRPDKYVVVDQQPFYYNLPQRSAAYAEPRQTPHDNELLILFQQILKNVSYRVLQPITERQLTRFFYLHDVYIPTDFCELKIKVALHVDYKKNLPVRITIGL